MAGRRNNGTADRRNERSCGRGSACIAAALLLLASAAVAQEAAGPSEFEQDLLRYRSAFDYGRFEPDLRSLLPSGTEGTWSLLAGVEGTYTDNLDQDRAGRDAFYVDGLAGLGWLKAAPRLQTSLDYRYRTDLFQSEAVDGRDHSSHRLAGALGWRASPHWTLSGGGHFAQEVETGVAEGAPGVRTTFGNRFDEYDVHGSAAGRVSRTLSNRTAYAFRSRDYASGAAEGTDTRAHRADSRFDWEARPQDAVGLGYAYAVEDDLDADLRRQNHLPTASWRHRFLGFPAGRPSTLGLSYEGDRALLEEAPDYWGHSAEARYELALSPRTGVHASGGYQWILPDEGGTRRGPRYGAGVDHRLSEWSTLALSASRAWEYVPASSRSDFTTLTRVTRGRAALTSRLGRDLQGELSADYEHGDVDPGLGGRGAETDYWQGRGAARLALELPASFFAGVDFSVARRSTDASLDDYLLQRAGLFLRANLTDWLDLSIRYSYEARDYDRSRVLSDYVENRVTAGLTARL